MRLTSILILAVLLFLCSTPITLGSINLSDVRDYVYTESCYGSGLTGDNLIIGIWEAPELKINNTTNKINHKVDKNLPEFEIHGVGSRVTVIEDFENVSSHATSVALIIGSNGSANHRGMAPEIEMWSYRSSGAAREMANSDVNMSTHSYAHNRYRGENI